MIRLKKEAPWNEVSICGRVINKKEWFSEDFDYRPIQKWLEFQSFVEVEQSKNLANFKDSENIETKEVEILDVKEEIKTTIDYSKMLKSELVELCNEKNISTTGKSKQQLIEELSSAI